MVAFVIYCIVSLIFIGFGISSFFAKRAVGFWANVSLPEIEDIKRYNRAVGWLWIIFGIFMILFGIPLLSGQNSPYVFISVFGIVFEIIAIMILYTRIERKYRKK